MGKKSEKDYITYSEWTNDFGGAKPKNLGISSEFKRLPFSCCILSLRPFEVPVCTVQGEIFDFMQIIPYLRRNDNKHPYMGTDLKPSELIRLNFQKNDHGDFYCPITRKTFNEHSKIVANRKSGNVFSWEAIETLNIEKNNWKDLISEATFTREDLIVLQDPQSPKNYSEIIKKAQAEKNAANFREGERICDRVNLSGGIGKVLRELKMTDIPVIQTSSETKMNEQSPDALHALAPHTTGKMAASLTSTSMAIKTNSELAVLDEAETLARYFPEGKETTGTICIRTNFGDLFFTLYASKSPRCCYNFIELTKAGYYDKVQFHRFVKGFILQGGDPSGTGRGGESCWKKPFGERLININNSSLNHNERGALSMANSGDPTENNSQFFITLRPAPHLNGKHPVFGKLLAGDEVLEKIETEVEVNAGHRPLTPIVIEDVFVLEDPFEEAKSFALKLSINKEIPSGKTKTKIAPVSTDHQTSTKNKVPQIGKYLIVKPRSK